VRGSPRPDWRSTDTEWQAELRAVAGPAAVDGKDPLCAHFAETEDTAIPHIPYDAPKSGCTAWRRSRSTYLTTCLVLQV